MLTVIMATYNGAQTLSKVLQAYCNLEAPLQGWKLLVVDNGSSDDSKLIIESFSARLPLTYLFEGRRGKNAALNSALAMVLQDSSSELFVFTDDDATPAPDWLLSLSACADAHPDHAVFGGAIVADWAIAPPDWIARLVPLGLTYAITAPDLADGPIFPGLVWGANMALRRQIFDAGYRFDDTIGPNGATYAMGSETELTLRLSTAGYRSWFCRDAQVAHFIRAHQMERDYVLQRAYRFGRGKFRQDGAPDVPSLWGVPRWMLRRFAAQLWGAGIAFLRRNEEQLFLRRWELDYLRGYFYEAWFARARSSPRVLITSYSGELGGMELRMGQEARMLAAAGYHSALAVRQFSGFDGWAKDMRTQRIEVSVFEPPLFFESWKWRRLNKWRAQVFGARMLRRYRPDLVHVAFCWSTYGASVLWLVRHCRLPAVISVHNAFPPAEISAWHQSLLAEAFRSVRGIYAVSESAMQHFLRLFKDYILPQTRLAVIPNSVDTTRFHPSEPGRATARSKLKLPANSLVLGSVARLSAQKRPQALLALFCTLRQQFLNLYLVLVGSGPLEQQLRVQAEAAGVDAYVIFTGYTTEIENIMPAFDLHLLLSRNEGFGIATIEAMACGVPVVGTDVPGTSDILRHSQGGILVPLDDEAATATAVAGLLSDPQRRQRMARHARAEMEAGYTSASVEEMVLDFYRGLI